MTGDFWRPLHPAHCRSLRNVTRKKYIEVTEFCHFFYARRFYKINVLDLINGRFKWEAVTSDPCLNYGRFEYHSHIQKLGDWVRKFVALLRNVTTQPILKLTLTKIGDLQANKRAWVIEVLKLTLYLQWELCPFLLICLLCCLVNQNYDGWNE